MVCDWLKISQLFYNFAGGIGLLLAGFGGLIVLIKWIFGIIEKNKVETITKKLKQRYPIKDFNKTFELIRAKDRKPIYILDKKGKFKIWIDSQQRLNALGFKFGDERTTTKAEVDSYEEKKIFYK